MFERFSRRVEHAARRRADAHVEKLSERMRDELPDGVRIEAIEGGVRLTGRALMRRFLLYPTLRWLALRVL